MSTGKDTVTLRVATELDPSAAPRVFGYLGGLGHVPLQAALRRDAGQALIIEVQFASAVPMAEKISAKVEQMPFVLTASVTGDATPGTNSAPDEGSEEAVLNIMEGMQHAPMHSTLCHPRVTAATLQFTAAQRSHAIRHRSRVHHSA